MNKDIKTSYKISMIITGVIINMCLGSVYSWSVFRKPIEGALNISSLDSGLPFMVFLIMYALAMPFAGSFIEKVGPKKMTMIGGVIISSGWIFSGFITSIHSLIFTYGVLGGIGVGIIYGVPLAVSAKWFPKKKGIAVGFTLGGFGLSPFVTAPLAQLLIDRFGVFSAFIILGLSFLFVITLLSMRLKFPEVAKENNKLEESIDTTTIKELITDRKFITLWITFVIGTFAGLMAIGISSPVAQEIIGITPEKSAIFVSLFAIFNGGGRPIFGALTDKYKGKISALLSYVIIIVASVLMLTASQGSITTYVVAFSMFWLVLGGWLAIAPTSIINVFGSQKYTRNYGFLFTAYGVGAILSTVVSGFIKDNFESYRLVFVPTMLMAIVGILVVLFFSWEKKENISINK